MKEFSELCNEAIQKSCWMTSKQTDHHHHLNHQSQIDDTVADSSWRNLYKTDAERTRHQYEAQQHDHSMWQSTNTMFDKSRDQKALYQAQACWYSQSLASPRIWSLLYNCLLYQIKKYDC